MPRTLAETMPDTAVGDVIHFDFLYLGDSEEVQGRNELDDYA